MSTDSKWYVVRAMGGKEKKVCTYIKEVVIMRMIRGLLKVVGATTYPIIGMFMVIMKFLDFIDAFLKLFFFYLHKS